MFDATVRAPSGVLYCFRGDVFWDFDELNGGLQQTHPQLIRDHWPGVPDNVDAAFRGQGTRRGKIYFFKARRYWRVTWDPQVNSKGAIVSYGHVDKGYPKFIKGAFADHWDNGFDAVIDFRDALRFAFRRDLAREHDGRTDKRRGGSLPITERFDGVLSSRHDHPRELTAGYAGEDSLRSNAKRNHLYLIHYNRQKWRSSRVDFRAETVVYDHDRQNPQNTHRAALSSDSQWDNLTTALTTDREATIARFRAQTTPTAFPQFPRGLIADQLIARVEEPLLISQSNIGFCGPASIVYWLVKTQPDVYIKIVTELYNEGKFRAHGDQVNPSDAFLGATSELAVVGRRRIAEIDWMVMGAMRDAAGVMDLTGDGDDQTGTRKGIMQNWCAEILGFQSVGFDRSRVVGEHKALESADAAFNSLNKIADGRHVQGLGILEVNADLLADALDKKSGKTNDDDTLFDALADKVRGNHWVVYEGDNASDPGKKARPNDGQFTFDLFSWGEIFRIRCDEKTFRKNMFGTIWAK
ncbi:hypothetical protein ACMU_13650 [Actibacterium mucosum KCTC 23349]|uniref:Uncharacterized protein n=1 Tax=Actibacterium mucosum KCTC 23349 TaxID=1454373 RepID=A0A037ZLK5_9RHOB|nr:hemopexin repeat-containing protein [Actibacterium mucosum]KAJ55726.1 hypothetical protein ACMU_13650 [Actibacterium mucosum KCTC 23349]